MARMPCVHPRRAPRDRSRLTSIVTASISGAFAPEHERKGRQLRHPLQAGLGQAGAYQGVGDGVHGIRPAPASFEADGEADGAAPEIRGVVHMNESQIGPKPETAGTSPPPPAVPATSIVARCIPMRPNRTSDPPTDPNGTSRARNGPARYRRRPPASQAEPEVVRGRPLRDLGDSTDVTLQDDATGVPKSDGDARRGGRLGELVTEGATHQRCDRPSSQLGLRGRRPPDYERHGDDEEPHPRQPPRWAAGAGHRAAATTRGATLDARHERLGSGCGSDGWRAIFGRSAAAATTAAPTAASTTNSQ